MKSQQESVLKELKNTEEAKTKAILEIDGLLKAKKDSMDKDLQEKLAHLNSELFAKKEALDNEYGSMKESREKEYKDIRMQQDNFLNDLRQNEEHKIRTMLEESQKMIKSQRDTKILNVQNSLENFFGELHKTASGDITEHIPLLRDNLKRLVHETLSNEYAGEESELRKILDYNPEISNKHKKFWKKFAISAGVSAVLISYFLYNPKPIQEIPNQVKNSVDEIDRENRLKTQQQLEAMRQASIYRPNQDLNFKFNYTDNAIFTKHYKLFEADEPTHKEWTLRLNKFLIEKAGVSDDEAIQIIASEASLITALESKKDLIEGKNPESGIKAMRAVEEDFQKTLQTTLKKNQEEFWNLKKELYLKFIQENSARFPAEESSN
jgi:hypothetical protein